MLKIRLKRVGRRNRPSFRMVVVESTQGPKSSKAVETVGFFNPITKDKEIKGDRVEYWMSVGAQPSDTVHNMLVTEGIIKADKKNVLPRKNPIEKEKEEAADEKPEVEEKLAEEGGDEKPAEEVKAEEPKDETKLAEETEEEPKIEKKEKKEEPAKEEEAAGPAPKEDK